MFCLERGKSRLGWGAAQHLGVKVSNGLAFGGADFCTMYITTARDGASAEEVAAQPDAGGIFACKVEVAGRAEPRYLD